MDSSWKSDTWDCFGMLWLEIKTKPVYCCYLMPGLTKTWNVACSSLDLMCFIFPFKYLFSIKSSWYLSYVNWFLSLALFPVVHMISIWVEFFGAIPNLKLVKPNFLLICKTQSLLHENMFNQLYSSMLLIQ